jgi:hypothetical protein
MYDDSYGTGLQYQVEYCTDDQDEEYQFRLFNQSPWNGSEQIHQTGGRGFSLNLFTKDDTPDRNMFGDLLVTVPDHKGLYFFILDPRSSNVFTGGDYIGQDCAKKNDARQENENMWEVYPSMVSGHGFSISTPKDCLRYKFYENTGSTSV